MLPMQFKNNITRLLRNKAYRWSRIIVLCYVIGGIAAYHLQEKFLFHPEKVDATSAYNFRHPHREVSIPVDGQTSYHLVQFTTRGAAKGVVLYFHGNKENVARYADAASNFTNNGYEVWMIDYPGYGKSTGELTEEAMYQQALQVYKMARSKYAPGEIVIYGRSLGSGIAAHLASIRDCKNLILETPYYSLTSVASRYLWMYPVESMMRYRLPTFEYLDKVTAPVTIFHGTDDGVIPYDNAVQLKNKLKPGDEFVTINGGSHNDLANFALMKRKLDQLLGASSSISATSL